MKPIRYIIYNSNDHYKVIDSIDNKIRTITYNHFKKDITTIVWMNIRDQIYDHIKAYIYESEGSI